jgi:hypothetical protein
MNIIFSIFLVLNTYGQMVELPLSPVELPCRIEADSTHVFVIKSSKELEEKGCGDIEYPFLQNSIIGVSGVGTGCRRPVVRLQLFQDTREEKYLIIATVVQFGACRPILPYLLTVECDRLNPDYKVEIRFRKEFR